MTGPRRARCLVAALWLALALATSLLPPMTGAQGGWAREPTYRYAGTYHGEWVSDSLSVALASEPGSGILLFTAKPGHLRGPLEIVVGCDGAVRIDAQAQSDSASTYTALVSAAGSLRLVDGRLNLIARATLAGRLTTHAADEGSGHVDLAADEAVTVPATGASPGGVSVAQRWQAADSALRWQLLAGEPGRLQGTWDNAGDVALPAGPGQPALRLSARGSWTAARDVAERCPWRGHATARGAVVEGQMHEETLEFVFRTTADGHLEGEGTGHASVYGGTPGGCQYTGGGAFAVRVGGEYRGGQFRVQLTDDDQPQLLVTTTCPSGQYVAPQGLLATAFGTVELAEAPGAHGEATVSGDSSGVLDVGIEPVGELAPP